MMFVGQAMPRIKGHPHDWPSLNRWLFSIGLTMAKIENFCYFSALVDYFPGTKGKAHRIPSEEEIVSERGRLGKNLRDFGPEIVIPVGRLSIAHCLGRRVEPLGVNVGKKYRADPYLLMGCKLTVIPLPHPSGASSWRYSEEGKRLLPRALELLRESV